MPEKGTEQERSIPQNEIRFIIYCIANEHYLAPEIGMDKRKVHDKSIATSFYGA